MTDPRLHALALSTPGDGPAVVARAPARVNLIGEHTDYNGLPVLPIAIDRDVLVAARRRPDDAVELSNVDPAFEPRHYSLRGEIPPFPPGDWANYHKAAAVGLRDALAREHALPGGSFRVHGTIPIAAGLSSSSALVVACGLAHLALADVELPRLELAELLAGAERYVGTLGGGMDQATTLLARAGHALHIDFFPLRARPVPVPTAAGFVVAHSLEPAEKSGRVRGLYNQRVVECRLAVRCSRDGPGWRPPGSATSPTGPPSSPTSLASSPRPRSPRRRFPSSSASRRTRSACASSGRRRSQRPGASRSSGACGTSSAKPTGSPPPSRRSSGATSPRWAI